MMGMKGGMHDHMASCPMQVDGTSVRAEDVDGGAALVFTTEGDLAELRERVKKHADHMQAGGCSMMKHGAAEKADSPAPEHDHAAHAGEPAE
jgi:hypothetical protein